MAINDANRSRKTYSFYRAQPVPVSQNIVVSAPEEDMVVNPIQNVRFLDPSFVGEEQNGSIVTPYSSGSQFFTEVIGSSAGWQLLLPGNDQDDPVSFDITELGSGSSPIHVVFQGVGKGATHLNVTSVARQTGSYNSFTFRDLSIESNITFNGDSLALTFENVSSSFTFGSSTPTNGTLRLVNCDINAVNLSAVTMTVDSCKFGDPGGTSFFKGVRLSQGIIRNSEFLDDSTLAITSDDTVTLIGCSFGGSCDIDIASNRIIRIDGFTYDSIRRSGVSYSNTEPTYKLFEWNSVAADLLYDSGGTMTIPTGSITQFTFPNPSSVDPVNYPQPQPDRGCVVNFRTLFSSSPFGPGIAIVASSIDSSGNVLVDIANTSVDEGTTSGVYICVVYMPRVSP